MLSKIDHVGIAVRSLAEAIPFYRDTLSMQFMGAEVVPEFQVKVAFFQIGESKVELLEPTSPGSFLVPFLEGNGEGVHHLAYQVEDVEAAIDRLKGQGTKMLDDQPRAGAHGTRVAFLDRESCHGVLTELCQPAK